MKKAILFLFFTFYTFLTISAQKNNKIDKANLQSYLLDMEDSTKANKYLPRFCSIGNNPLVNDSIKGYITFINIWISNCSPCIAEVSALNNLYNLYKDNRKFKFISITPDDDKTIRAFIAEHKIQFPVYRMTKQNCYKLNMNSGFPTNILVRANGKIEKFISGGATDDIIANELIKTGFYSKIDSLLQRSK